MTRLIGYATALAAGAFYALIGRAAATLIRTRPPDNPTQRETSERDQYRPPVGDRPYRWI